MKGASGIFLRQIQPQSERLTVTFRPRLTGAVSGYYRFKSYFWRGVSERPRPGFVGRFASFAEPAAGDNYRAGSQATVVII
jgi:hypothetical protein